MNTKTLLFLLLFFLTGCDLARHRKFHDPALNLQKKDYESILKPPPLEKARPPYLPKENKNLQIPSLFLTPISVTLHENTPLKRALSEVGRQAGVGMGLSQDINQQQIGITYSVHRTPCIDVLKDLCLLTNLRFQIHGNRVLIEPDTPYLSTYNVQFLNQIRKSENRISISTDVFSPLENQGRMENGSDSVLINQSLIDFWTELEGNLKLILPSHRQNHEVTNPSYTIHRQAGLISILGTTQQHEQIKTYLKKLQEASSTQVIIEAKIIEVTLHNEFKSGINWSQLGGDVHFRAPLGSLGRPYSFDHQHHHTTDHITFAVEHEKFSAVLNLVKKFGTIRTLSNPRLTVMNNQPAMLKVATNEVFFHLEFERYFQAEGKPDIENISSDALTVPIGLVMVVQPSVNTETGEITMTLRPTLSRVQKEVEDPAVAIKSHQRVKSTIPVVQVRELDSVLKMKSGQIMVMGGLMEDHANYASTSIPGADEIPLLGELARGKDDDQNTTELVIFLTAHIVEDPFIMDADKRLYNYYTEDPRPLNFCK